MRNFLTAVYVLSITAIANVNANHMLDTVEGLQLAKQYDQSRTDINVADYWVSEKLDGIRARWNGTELFTRNGNKIFAPPWFTANWPKAPIDGELWIGRGEFERTASIVLSHNLFDERWLNVRFMVFDMPLSHLRFSQRLHRLTSLVNASDSRTIAVIRQTKLQTHEELEKALTRITKNGGEGLMLHHVDSVYLSGRSDNLLKVKQFEDAEARVLSYIEGRGQFEGMMGSLVVETRDGVRFRLGSGFSKAERFNPPSIGSWVTFKFYGVTRRGKPRFASFLRVRPSGDVIK